MPFTSRNLQIEWKIRELECEREAWLRSKGWKQTSQTIGSYWMWEREIGGRVYLVGTESACQIQDSMDADAYYRLHPEEYLD